MPGLLLATVFSFLPGVAAFVFWRGPRLDNSPRSGPSERDSLPAAAVLRDGTGGATRWAYAALLLKLARDGHCTLVRTRKRRWLQTGPALTIELHADPHALSPFEQRALRRLARHDTLGGFGFAGSTFRRRTLRDVRTRLVERGWLADRHRRSNACLMVGLALLTLAALRPAAGLSLLVGAACAGGGAGSLLSAGVRHPITETGAQRRAAHRAHAHRRRDQICALLPDHPQQAALLLVEALPALVLERIATPHWLAAVADRFDAGAKRHDATGSPDSPDWLRDEIDDRASFAEACRLIGRVLSTVGARTPIAERLKRSLLSRNGSS